MTTCILVTSFSGLTGTDTTFVWLYITYLFSVEFPLCNHDRCFFFAVGLKFYVHWLSWRQVEHIIVLGHKNCGGIRALMTRSDFSSDFIGSWMKIALPAKDHTLELLHNHPLEEQCSYCERESINVSLGNLLSFPWLEERFKQGSLELHGWYYDFVEGSMASWKVACSSAAGVSKVIA
jgi:hypothetical protein